MAGLDEIRLVLRCSQVWVRCWSCSVFELALASSDEPEWTRVSAGFENARMSLPWQADHSFKVVMSRAWWPQTDLRVRTALGRERAFHQSTAPGQH